MGEVGLAIAVVTVAAGRTPPTPDLTVAGREPAPDEQNRGERVVPLAPVAFG